MEHTCKISEIDKFAIKSYNAIHGETENLGDILKIDILPYADLVTYSFPCQDLSIAGKQEGIKEGTRSGLLLEVERLIENMDIKPKFLLMENVKNLVSKKHKPDFDKWLSKLEEMGYVNYWKVLNAKDYGIPQNRERIFVLSIKKELDNGFEFPEPLKLKLRLKDMLEDKVDDKFYLSEEKSYKLIKELSPEKFDCIDTKMPKNSKSKLSKTILASCYKEPLQVVCEQRCDEGLRFFKANLYGTIRTIDAGGDKRIITSNINEDYRIRKLTPRECWRLMGFSDEQFEKAEKICSNTQLYKQAGNSIVVNVLEAIIDKMVEYGYLETK